MKYYRFLLGTMAAWRLSHLLYGEDGPWDVFVRLRRFAGDSIWGTLLDCFLCLSLWIAAPIAVLLGSDWRERIMLWLALSTGAILLEDARGQQQVAQTAWYVEDKEN